MKLTQKDYLTILEHYDVAPPKNTKGSIDKNKVKDEAERILATKLCRCIKKVDPMNETKGISVCTDSIFKRRNIKYNAFKCSPAFTLLKTKRNRNAIKKTRKRIKF
jgi:hypothetical protein